MKNIMSTINTINREYEDMDFTMQNEGDTIHIFDKNEVYHIGYAENMFYLMIQLADEFGFEVPDHAEDTIYDMLNEAVKADFGKDAFLDWYDTVRLCVAK